ncbi:MAG: hypothetical protein VYC17_00240 [Nitrospinota bacterium]|nr:hypothetical protein [Nitrospinota bacterium]
MKSKGFVAGMALLVAAAMAAPRVLNGLGTFLVVEERADKVDAVVTGWIPGKTLDCYLQGQCKKIIVALPQLAPESWLALQWMRSEKSVRENAREAGVKDEDLYLLFVEAENDLRRAQRFAEFFDEKKIRSVLFLSSYYKTRRNRFYFDRSLEGNETVVYVQPYEAVPDIHDWWKQTTYANFFLGEYLRIGWYFFNKLLWTSAV